MESPERKRGGGVLGPSPARYRLIVYRDSSVRTILLEGSRWVVGRGEDCEIRIHDATASRHHLVLERRADGIWFRDLGGVNATLLDGRPSRGARVAVGGTLLVGMTRLTLDTIKAQAKVRIDPKSRTTVVLERRYLEAAKEPASPASLSRESDLQLVDRLAWSFSDLGSLEEVGNALLDVALDQTKRQRGLIGVFDPMSRITLIASQSRIAGGAEVRVPQQLLQDARMRKEPFLAKPIGKAGSSPERLVSPLGPDGNGVLVLDSPLRGAPEGQDALRSVQTLAALIWRRIEDAQERRGLREEVQRLRFQRSPVNTAILASSRLQTVCQELRRAARHTMPVCLVGEAGTEVEDLARYLHAQSPRFAAPFVTFHASVVPAVRAEDELFGRPPARAARSGSAPGGALLRAYGGTLYLESPELLPEAVQERLARVLRDRVLVSTQEPKEIPLDVQVVSAIAPDAAQPGEARAMRPALAEHLLGVRVEVPPLREEPDDIAPLCELILTEMGPAPDHAPRSITDAARRLLIAHPWPGNLRQLRRVLEVAAARAGTQPIAPKHLPPELHASAKSKTRLFPTLAEVEKRQIQHVLLAVGSNRRAAAEQLGIAISTLYDKIRRYGIKD